MNEQTIAAIEDDIKRMAIHDVMAAAHRGVIYDLYINIKAKMYINIKDKVNYTLNDSLAELNTIKFNILDNI